MGDGSRATHACLALNCWMRGRWIASGFVAMAAIAAGCGKTEPPARQVTVNRPAGTWEGTGNRTIGFISESGRFDVTWETRNERPAGAGTFRLTVHSAVSGRPIQVLADQRGEQRGRASVADDPRPYNFMVESANIDWSIAVEEIVAADGPPSTVYRPPSAVWPTVRGLRPTVMQVLVVGRREPLRRTFVNRGPRTVSRRPQIEPCE